MRGKVLNSSAQKLQQGVALAALEASKAVDQALFIFVEPAAQNVLQVRVQRWHNVGLRAVPERLFQSSYNFRIDAAPITAGRFHDAVTQVDRQPRHKLVRILFQLMPRVLRVTRRAGTNDNLNIRRAPTRLRDANMNSKLFTCKVYKKWFR